MTAKTKPWRFDFAGRHGTAWGAANLCLSVITLTTCEHVFFDAPWWVAGATVLAGVVATLLKVSFQRAATEPVTLAYKLTCWAGAGIWSAWMLNWASWNMHDWGIRILVLAVMALGAGILFALGAEDKPETDKAQAQLDPEAELTQRNRNALAKQWGSWIQRLASAPITQPAIVDISAIEAWENGGGYTIEGKFTSGAFGLIQLTALSTKLADEANLPFGCGIRVYSPGEGGRREFLIDVTTRNALTANQPYPINHGPFSINGPIPIGVQITGEPQYIEIRQRNMAVYGTTGSGKTGGMKAVTATLALTADAIMIGIDATGADLVRPCLEPWEAGQCDHPMFSAVATSYEEAEQACRAVIRIGHARKAAYGQLMRQHKTTLIPCGAEVYLKDLHPNARKRFTREGDDRRIVPFIAVVADETTQFLRRKSSYPELTNLFLQGMQELRGGGIRYVIPPLGGDDNYINTDTQKLVQTVAVLRMTASREYKTAFDDHNCKLTPADFPAETNGNGYIRDMPGQKENAFRFYGEITADIMDQIAIRASKIGAIPDLDYISELAADGFMADGSPWPMGPEMKPADVNYWTNRWNGWGERRFSKQVDEDQAVTVAAPRIEPKVAPNASMQDAAELLKKASAVTPIGKQDAESQADRWDWTVVEGWIDDASQGKPAIKNNRELTWQENVMQALRKSGPDGMKLADIMNIAGRSRETTIKFLSDQTNVHKPKYGFYAISNEDA